MSPFKKGGFRGILESSSRTNVLHLINNKKSVWVCGYFLKFIFFLFLKTTTFVIYGLKILPKTFKADVLT